MLLGGVGLVLVLVVVGTVVWWNGGVGTLVGRERCVARVGGTTVTLSPTQAEHAATIAAVAARRGLPARAVTIAIATAFQESDLNNLPHGDRDSAGLFQQRPSQGWGTFAQVTDPVHASQRFFDALVAVPGWQSLAITRAAQAVQRSAFPDAYQQHADAARTLALVLTGKAPHALSCTVRASDEVRQRPGSDGLTPRAAAVRAELGDALDPAAFHVPTAAAERRAGLPAGTSFDVVTAARDDHAAQRQAGWTAAAWLVANASRLHVSVVAYDGHVWSAQRSPEGWRTDRTVGTGRSPGRVHVEVVWGEAATSA